MLHQFINIEAVSIVSALTMHIKVIKTSKFHALSDRQAMRAAKILYDEVRTLLPKAKN